MLACVSFCGWRVCVKNLGTFNVTLFKVGRNSVTLVLKFTVYSMLVAVFLHEFYIIEILKLGHLRTSRLPGFLF